MTDDTTTPRPNVAMGAFMGFLTMMLGLLLTALQANPTTLEGWLVALQPLVGFAIAYLAPPYKKAWAALIGAGLIPFILMVQSCRGRRWWGWCPGPKPGPG
jgi:hypothetical protein